MRAIVADDELPARQSLEQMLARSGEVEVVASCANAFEALAAIQAEAPDVLFLDIQMPKVGGFELLGMIDPEAMPRVVFVTAWDEYAVKAFEENAFDYLLKPVQSERLQKTLEKLKRASGARPVFAGPPLERIPCTGAHSIRLVTLDEVEYVHSSAAGVYVVTPRGEFFTDLTLQVLEVKTPLVRCHKQHLVGLGHIEQIVWEGPRDTVLRTKSGKQVPVGRRYLPVLKEKLGIAGV
jgi:two-component system, LytTR family, response regulator